MARTLETIAQDLRFGARALGRNPGFALVAVLTLALGIGANAAIFSVVNAVLLRPLPWHDADRAVMIWSRWTAFDKTWVAEGEVLDYRRRSKTLQEVGAWGEGQVNLTGGGEPERVAAGAVTANLFSTLGVSPMIGRTFTAAEDVPKGPDLVVLGHGLWTRRYASDAGIVGKAITINGRPYTVVGIMPPQFVLPTDFQNPEPSQLWTPLQMDPASTDHGNHGLYAAGRLAPGATVQQAAEELHRTAEAMTNEGLYPKQMQFDTVVLSLADEVLGPVRRAMLLLFGAVGFLLLIACANVANLLLARAEARQREIAVRTALGAGALRIVRQLLTESFVLTAISTFAGLGIAIAVVRFVAWWNPANIPRVAAVSVDAPVLLFTALLAVLTNVIFSLAPALRAVRVDLTGGLKDGSQSASTGVGRQRFRNTLVVAELALAVILLVGAGLMLRSLWSLQGVALGFDPTNVLTMRIALPQTGYPTPEHVVSFYQRLLDRVRDVPGVRSAAAVRSLPLGSTIGDWGLQVDGYVPPPGTNAKGDWQVVTDGYFETMGERIVRGRALTAADTSDSMLVAVVNEELARRYFAGRDPIGGRMKIGSAARPWVTIVGVVADVRHNGITEVIKEKFYVPHAQWSKATTNTVRGMTLVVKGTTDPRTLARAVREEIRVLDAALPVANVRTMSDVVGATLSAPRFAGMLFAAFAVLALVLSAIGIYGVLSYLVTRRMREIGVRLAIGATRTQVLRMVLQNALGLALIGIVLGLLAAAWASRLMTGLLHGVAPGDPATFATVGVALVVVATLASLVPALRATRVDPAVALRTE